MVENMYITLGHGECRCIAVAQEKKGGIIV